MPRVLASLVGIVLVFALLAAARRDRGSQSPEDADDPRRDLRAAVELRDIDRATDLLEGGVEPSRSITYFARLGDDQALEWFFARGAEAGGRSGARALLSALSTKKTSTADLLRRHGAHLDGTDESGITLLMSAASGNGRGRTLQALVEFGADVNAQSLAGRTALMFLAKTDRPIGARRVLAAGAAVDARDRDGWTALMLAARDGRTVMTDLLLQAGADPNAESALGWTPLMWAAWYGHTRVLRSLLDAGADPDATSYVGGTALIRAVQMGRPHPVVALINAGARPELEFGGLNAFGWAHGAGRVGIVRILRRAGR